MPDPVAQVSRAASQRLSDELDPGLALDVEEALQRRGKTHRPERYLDPLSLGGLIVSVASLAWTVFNDMRDKRANPTQEVVTRRVRVDLDTDDRVAPAQRDRIIEVVVNEIIVAARPDTGET